MTHSNQRLNLVAVMIAIGLLFGCGGGGGGGGSNPAATQSVSGTASKGLIQNGTVQVYAIDSSGLKGSLLASTQTDGNGHYNVDISHSGPVLVEVSGGTYVDEATGISTALSGVLRAALPSVSGNVDAAVTPLTEIATRLAEQNGFSAEKINAANELLSQLTGCSVIDTQPADPGNPGAFGSASADQQNYALFLAALSQLAQDGGFTDIMAAIEFLEEDLSDLELEESGLALQNALSNFLINPNNASGATSAGTLTSLLSSLMSGGLAPTGTLSELKELLVAFLKDPSGTNYDAFISYMQTFTPDSQEARLFTAMATLLDIYNNSALDFITDDSGGMGINFSTDWETFNLEQALDDFLRSGSYGSDVAGMFAELESRLDQVYTDLNLAAGIRTSISLTGFDTVYIDDIDVDVLKAMTQLFKALCVYVQSPDLTIVDWNVTPDYAGQPADIRTIVIQRDESPTTSQKKEVMDNNTNFCAYADTTKLTDFQVAVSAALTDVQSAVSALESLGASGREGRYRNAFNLDSEYALWMMKAISEHTLPSMIAALADSSASIEAFESEEVGSSIVVGADGHNYWQITYDIYLENQDPVGGYITPHDLISAAYAPRDVFYDLLDFEQAEEDYAPYVTGSRALFRSGVTETLWDEPF